MNPRFEEAFRKLILVERGYSNVPGDSGGPTRWGITELVARANGYRGPMSELPLETAKGIYYTQWWGLLNLDAVSEISTAVAEEIFDTAVNCGPGIAGKFLQQVLNVLNREERDYQDVRKDGLIGPLTVMALRGYFAKRGDQGGELVLLKALNGLQCARYIEIAEGRKKDERFTFGWLKERVKI